MDEGTFGVHQVEFVVEPSPCLCDGRRVRKHTDSPLNFRQISSRHCSRRLIVNSDLKLKFEYWITTKNTKYWILKIVLINYFQTLKPVGHQSTNCMLLFVLIFAIAAFTSFGTTSPLYSRQQAMYFPWRGSHLTIWLFGSKQAFVISDTESCSW